MILGEKQLCFKNVKKKYVNSTQLISNAVGFNRMDDFDPTPFDDDKDKTTSLTHNHKNTFVALIFK